MYLCWELIVFWALYNVLSRRYMPLGTVIATAPTAAQLAGGLLVLGGVTVSMLPSRRSVVP
jgi:hypothetical protein